MVKKISKSKSTNMSKETYDFWITLLKGTTYAVLTSAGTAIVQYMGDGVDIKTCLVTGGVVGILAGIKNIVKFVWNIDIDFARIRK
jgi:hypothetical protein